MNSPASALTKTAGSGWFVYMLECNGGRIYTGIAVDVAARYEKHRSGRGAAFTRMHKPRRILAVMACADRSEASKVEAQLKKLERPDKLLWAGQRPWVGQTGC
jgi:putative endonuclease